VFSNFYVHTGTRAAKIYLYMGLEETTTTYRWKHNTDTSSWKVGESGYWHGCGHTHVHTHTCTYNYIPVSIILLYM